ncbi:MAG: hypothetical protein QGG36_11050 [Pirellulaceae bacterium]|jgi:hypothetical protein|nr:hypothetical protein [Pirellulaceae bacterium]
MQPLPTPNEDFFSVEESTATALGKAVAELAELTGRSLVSFESMTLGEICAFAEERYDELPEFWRIWKDWNRPDLAQPMGDL